MKDILHKTTVLVLNRNWQAIHTKTPAEAFCMMASGSATGLDVHGDDHISPVRWEDWLKLPIRDEDHAVNTPRGAVRVPTVIVAANYAKVPICRPRFGARGIWERDGRVECRPFKASVHAHVECVVWAQSALAPSGVVFYHHLAWLPVWQSVRKPMHARLVGWCELP